MKAGWKKDTLARVYYELRKEYRAQLTASARAKRAEQEAVDAIAVQLIEEAASRISRHEVKH